MMRVEGGREKERKQLLWGKKEGEEKKNNQKAIGLNGENGAQRHDDIGGCQLTQAKKRFWEGARKGGEGKKQGMKDSKYEYRIGNEWYVPDRNDNQKCTGELRGKLATSTRNAAGLPNGTGGCSSREKLNKGGPGKRISTDLKQSTRGGSNWEGDLEQEKNGFTDGDRDQDAPIGTGAAGKREKKKRERRKIDPAIIVSMHRNAKGQVQRNTGKGAEVKRGEWWSSGKPMAVIEGKKVSDNQNKSF